METEKPEIFKLLVITTIDDLTKEIDLIKRQKGSCRFPEPTNDCAVAMLLNFVFVEDKSLPRTYSPQSKSGFRDLRFFQTM